VSTTTHDIVRAYLAGHLSIRTFETELANFADPSKGFLRDVSKLIDNHKEARISENQLKQSLRCLLAGGEDV
jgi:hypothetical protein